MFRFFLKSVLLISCITIVQSDSSLESDGMIPLKTCSLSPELLQEIHSYKDIADKIIKNVVHGSLKGRAHGLLKDFVTKFYHRISGSKILEKSIDYIQQYMKNNGLETSSQNVPVPYWKRGNESAELLEPRRMKIDILGLGNTVATGPDGIEAEAVIYNSIEELNANPGPAFRKIVIMYNEWRNYDYAKRHRSDSASVASKAGAVAVLIRSAAPVTLKQPHTGSQDYAEGVTKIPSATISIEDAELLDRLSKANNGTTPLIIKLLMVGHESFPDTTSRNSFGKHLGSKFPKERILLTGHIDSWDIGEGALDDGVGIASAIESVLVLKSLGLNPKRTVEAVCWTSEEPGYYGVDGYIKEHADELKNILAAFEADYGLFRPLGFDIAANDEGACIVKEILEFFKPINATSLRRFKTVSSDISHLTKKANIPGFHMNTDDEKYFWYHHTNADTLLAVNSHDLDIAVAMYSITSYILADLSIPFPKANYWPV